MDMRLYRMELYKLLYKKIFRFGLLAVLGILLAYFLLVSVGEERTMIDGEVYTGFAAVREDRRITEKFRGVLTDEKGRQIIEQYGFPSKVEENYGGFRDENYLNGFVTEQLGNGYYFSWDDYQISTALQPLAESGLGAAARAAGREVLLDYAEGWGVFLDLLQLGMILGSALIVTVVSPVFSEEHQTKMSTLLLASRNGREGAAFAKEAAAFTAAALIYAATAAAAFSMTGLVYGFRGGSCMSGMVLTPHGLNTALAFTLKPVAWASLSDAGCGLLGTYDSLRHDPVCVGPSENGFSHGGSYAGCLGRSSAAPYSVWRRRLFFGLRDAHVPGYDRRINRMVQRPFPPSRNSSLHPRGQHPLRLEHLEKIRSRCVKPWKERCENLEFFKTQPAKFLMPQCPASRERA